MQHAAAQHPPPSSPQAQAERAAPGPCPAVATEHGEEVRSEALHLEQIHPLDVAPSVNDEQHQLAEPAARLNIVSRVRRAGANSASPTPNSTPATRRSAS